MHADLSASHDTSTELGYEELHKRKQRVQRFKETHQGTMVYNFVPSKGRRIIGTCETLEKPYLRLTAEPNPAMVRPEQVLKKSFRHVFDTFMNNRNYRYIEEQFRSIRQDVQVQHLRSPFVVKLYATNARLALVHGDLDQFNQCQTQLIQLRQHVTGFSHYWVCFSGHSLMFCQNEFEFYCLLYLSMQYMDMDVLRLALAEGNFVDYFKMADTSGIDIDKCVSEIYREAFSTEDFSESALTECNINTQDAVVITSPPFYSKFLFKMFEPRFRMNALVNMSRCVDPKCHEFIICLSTAITLSMETIKNALNFGSLEECASFIRENKGTLNQNGALDCKQSLEEFMTSPLLRNKKL
ncbi:SAC3/GANP family domain containing protein [Babesia divergens]|uniref:SAC3/GANP family domain containing protein n=1 Tax=Babesia divergens TaxID=32595 RepID=A0AAD9GFZ4_BABDI|nr:SAC3/GANP family domain containing protein [Babesia divergens]